MNPTEICLRLECREENWRRSWIRRPLPKELVMDARKARVGYSLDRARTQAGWDRVSYYRTSPIVGTSAQRDPPEKKILKKRNV